MKTLLATLLLLAAGSVLGEEAPVTFSWTIPTHATNGELLEGHLALTEHKVWLNGEKVANLDPDADQWSFEGTVGETIKVYVKACNAYGCTRSNVVRHTIGRTGNVLFLPAPITDLEALD